MAIFLFKSFFFYLNRIFFIFVKSHQTFVDWLQSLQVLPLPTPVLGYGWIKCNTGMLISLFLLVSFIKKK